VSRRRYRRALPIRRISLAGKECVLFWESDDAFLLEMEVPGVTRDQIDLTVADGELTARVEVPEVQCEGVTFHRRERPVGPLTRVVRLPGDVDIDKVEAELRHGVLTVRLPKTAAAKPRRIPVQT
jgi:HSP20 family protein